MTKKFILSAAALCALAAGTAMAAEPAKVVTRNGDSPGRPILSSVEVPASKNIVFLSGMVPSAINPEAPREQQTLGTMEQQTHSVLKKIDEHLKSIGLTMGDVIKAQAFLVADPATNKVDPRWLQQGLHGVLRYPPRSPTSRRARPSPSRASVVPTMFVEIEVIAVRP